MAHHAPAGVGDPTLARDWVLEIDTSAAPDPAEWTKVRGLTSFTPGLSATMTDASTYDDGEWDSQVPTKRSWSVSGTVQRAGYVPEGGGAKTYDPGQERLRALADSLDLAHIRYYESNEEGVEAYEGFCYVTWEPQGGDTAALKTVNFTGTGKGARQTITMPTP